MPKPICAKPINMQTLEAEYYKIKQTCIRFNKHITKNMQN